MTPGALSAEDLVEILKQQRNAYANDAAVLAAQYKHLLEHCQQVEAELAKLKMQEAQPGRTEDVRE